MPTEDTLIQITTHHSATPFEQKQIVSAALAEAQRMGMRPIEGCVVELGAVSRTTIRAEEVERDGD